MESCLHCWILTPHGDYKLRNKEKVDINGAAGNDLISGGEGDDTVFGAAGDDILSGNGGLDSLNGGVGLDTASDVGELLNINIEFLQ